MKRFLLGLLAAAFLHVLILLFGGIFFLGSGDEKELVVQDVEVLEADDDKEKEKERQEELDKRKVEEPPEKPPELQVAVEIEHEMPSLADTTPELAALSLSALESALGPGTAGGDFGSTFSLSSGGRIGGNAAAGEGESSEGNLAFSLGDLDQTARPLFQSGPTYPLDLRQRKIEGVVTVLFVVDAQGRVIEPKVERSTDPGFEASALDAVRRWKFEPAVRNGKKVPSKLRIPIRFSLSG